MVTGAVITGTVGTSASLLPRLSELVLWSLVPWGGGMVSVAVGAAVLGGQMLPPATGFAYSPASYCIK